MTLRTSIFTSLDGRIDADSDWQYPWFDGEFFEVLAEQWAGADALLIGRRSFEGYEALVAEHPDSPMVALLQSLPVTVVSGTRRSSEILPQAAFIAAPTPAAIDALEREHGRLLVLGSPTMLASLAENGALSTLTLIVIPVVVGRGARLFDAAEGPIPFQTRDVRSLTNGVVVMELERSTGV